MKRNRDATRLEQKPSKRDLVASEARLLRHDKEFELNTSDQRPFFYKRNYLKIVATSKGCRQFMIEPDVLPTLAGLALALGGPALLASPVYRLLGMKIR